MKFPLLGFKYFSRINIFEKLSVIVLLLQLCVLHSEAYYLDGEPYRHKQVLGPKASFVVEWTVNWKAKSITFQVSAETKGWIGFGLSRDGRMIGSDVVVGGVNPSGKPYFNDAHVTGNRSVHIDEHEDWKLLGAWEKGKRTYLKVSRAFDTCDLKDYPITNDLIVLIWAYGDTDTVSYHMKRRGSYPVYLLDPEISSEIAHNHYRQIGPHSNTLLVQRWAITNTIQLPARPTSVWCSIHRGPSLLARHDIVGMGAFLPNHLARRHVHHMIIYRCTSPQQTVSQTFFEPYARSRGEECYLNENRAFPLAFCREIIFVWGRGSRPFYFPEDIGIPLGENQNEYFLLETHYDNVKSKRNIEFEAGVEIIFSHRQKPSQASLLQIGYGPFGTFIIPPKSIMNIYGSCGPKCTTAMFPKEGVNVFAALLHSHSLARRIRLQHFRNRQELPWIVKDDNYDSEFQQMRLLPNEITVLPGDQLTTQCTFDSYERNRTSFSGFSAQDETCSAFVYISGRIPFFRCTSEYPAERLFTKYGVNNFTWDLNWHERYVISPKQMEGTWLGDVVDDKSQWRYANPDQLQQELQFSPHFESCPDIRHMMQKSQQKLFRTFTNERNQPNQHPRSSEPVATKTPYLSSSVTFPQDVQEYQEAPYCQSHYDRPRVPVVSTRLSVKKPQKPSPIRAPIPIDDYYQSREVPPSSTSTSSSSSEDQFKVPPLEPIDLNALIGGGVKSGPDFRIPMVQMRSGSTEKPKQNVFHQIANMIHPPNKKRSPVFQAKLTSPKLVLFQNIRIEENVLKKRSDKVSIEKTNDK